MSMRCSTDPYGGLNPLVDKIIGPKAYDFVKFVALRMHFIQKAASEPYTRLSIRGRTVGPVTTIPFPPTVLLNSMVDSTVWLTDPLTGARYNAESGYFTVGYTINGVTIGLSDAAPLVLRDAEVIWFLTAMEIPRA